MILLGSVRNWRSSSGFTEKDLTEKDLIVRATTCKVNTRLYGVLGYSLVAQQEPARD